MDNFKAHKLSCPNCSQLFVVKDSFQTRGQRAPLILWCGHSVCEQCIKNALSSSVDVVCGTCDKKSTPEDKSRDLYQMFPPNRYLMGLFSVKPRIPPAEDSKISFSHLNEKNRGSKSNKSVEEFCSECTKKYAAVCCIQCNVLYCNPCFTSIHKTGKALQKHTKVPAAQQSKLKQPAKDALPCDEHSENKLEFYCKACDKVICSHCIIISHQGHDVCTLKSKNKEGLLELQKASEKATEMLKRLLYTQKKVESCKTLPNASSVHTLPVEQEITKHFIQVHSMLQLLEQDMLQKLYKVKQERIYGLKDISSELDTNINNLKQLLDESASATDPAFLGLLNVSELTQKLLATKDLPCHLVVTTSGEPDRVKFDVNENFMDILKSHCNLDVELNTKHSLISTDELPSDFEVEPIADISLSGGSRTSSMSSSIDTGMNESPYVCSTSHEDKEPAFSKRNNSKKKLLSSAFSNLKEGQSVLVKVSHIKTPQDFYVHAVEEIPNVRSLEREISYLRAEKLDKPSDVTPGFRCLAQYTKDDCWYRARVCSVKSDNMIGVLYIDYGNYEIIPIFRLRFIPASLNTKQGFAMHCSLHGIQPTNNKWSPESIRTFVQLANDQNSILMVIMAQTFERLYVDLHKLPTVTASGNGPTSLKDTLVYMGCAVCTDKSTSPVIPHVSMKDYLKPQGLVHGDIFDGCVSQVNSPSSLYIQKLGSEIQYLADMMSEMMDEYSASHDSKSIFVPALNMPCAALYSLDKKWYRGRVVALPANNTVEVFYVDYGNKEIISRNKIRYLDEKYLKLPYQAIHCCLAYVIPAIGLGPSRREWSSTATQCLSQVTAEKVLRVFVDSVSATEVKVTLYDSQPNKEININALLAQKGYAKHIGVAGTLVEYQKNPEQEPTSVIAAKDQEKKTAPKRKKVLPSVMVPGVKKDEESTIQEKKVTSPAPPPQLVEEDSGDEAAADGKSSERILRLNVKILSVLSPSQFYVSLESQQHVLTSMFEDLQEFYGPTDCEPIEWAAGDFCVAYIPNEKLWLRGLLMKLEGDVAVVFLKDLGISAETNIKCLRLLDDSFRKVRDGAIRCHLAGIMAAGDRKEWPIMATEYFEELVSKYSSFSIRKKGEIEMYSLPVELWVQDITPGGPFNPTIEEWNTINNKLVEQGLAIPCRKEMQGETANISSGKLLKEIEEKVKKGDLMENTDIQTLKATDKNGTAYTSDKLKAFKEGRKLPLEALPQSENDESQSENDELEQEKETLDLSTVQLLVDHNTEKNISTKISSWLPPEPLKNMHFTCVPTYVDDEACIYLHDCDVATEILELIQKGLQTRFANSKPKPEDYFWFSGLLCIAQYHQDKKWYRGEVLSVNEKDLTVTVSFVDYGNVECCKATELRKNVCLEDIPVQCHKLQLYNLKPVSEDGKWPVPILDYIHSSIVDKVCQVSLRERNGKYYITSLIVPSGLNLFALLVQLNYASYAEVSPVLSPLHLFGQTEPEAEEDVIIEDIIQHEEIPEAEIAKYEEIPEVETKEKKEDIQSIKEECVSVDNEENATVGDINKENNQQDQPKTLSSWYELVTAEEKSEDDEVVSDDSDAPMYISSELEDLEEFLVEVSAVITPNKVYCRPLNTETEKRRNVKAKFENLTRELQVMGDSQPVLKDPYRGQPCCAMFTEDSCWYRAMIVSEEGDDVGIQYVDYGNIESLPRDRIHKLKEEWLDVPTQAVPIHLWRVTVPEDWKQTNVIEELGGCLFNKVVKAKIKELEPLSAELLSATEDVLLYQPLIDSGLLLLTDK